MQNWFSKIIEEWNRNKQTTKTVKVVRKTMLSSFLIASITVLIISVITEYFVLVPLTLKSPSFVVFVIFVLILFTIIYSSLRGIMDSVAKVTIGLTIFCGLYLGVGKIISSPIFNASKYQQQLSVDKNADFYKDNKTISFDSIPVVDKDSATRLGDRKMGEIVDYVSQFDVDEAYEQINYENKPFRVTPLEYSDPIKWFTNRSNGLPGYIKVDMVTQDADVVRLDEGMKYSKAEYFGRDVERHIQLNYPTYMFESIIFEIDDEGIPYWIAARYDYKIGLFGGRDIVGAVLVNAINGDHKYYDIDKVPTWVDRVYSSELVEEQLDNWGKFGNGYFNTLFSQKGVLQATDGYNYIALNDDVYYYSGLTSVSKDASNVGFILINLRTKEAKYYAISGAEEYSAMSSAEGQVQHLGYTATFPILVNIGGEPTYFLSLKDSAQLVKQYAFVSVENYQIVATGDSVAEAEKEYYKLLIDNGQIEEEVPPTIKEDTIEGVVVDWREVVKEGNTTYYFKLEGSDQIYIADIGLHEKLPFVKAGDSVKITYPHDSKSSAIVTKIEIK